MTCWCCWCCCWWCCCWLKSRGGEIGSFFTLMLELLEEEEEEGEWEFAPVWGLLVDTVNWPIWPPPLVLLPPPLLPLMVFNEFWFEEAQLWMVNAPWGLNTIPPVKSLPFNWKSSVAKREEFSKLFNKFSSRLQREKSLANFSTSSVPNSTEKNLVQITIHVGFWASGSND